MTDLLPSLVDSPPDLTGKVILVTGGTGSFGQAFVRRLLDAHDPAKVIVFSRDEQKHHTMSQTFRDKRLRFFIGDVRDRERMMRALTGVDIVVHSAAMKHVSIAEYNPLEAIRTNIDGATNVIDAAIERGVQRVVALSTDKACSPVNLYGATKLCMEKLFVAANSLAGAADTRFNLVRYGNVVGSKGSVVPLFQQQKLEGTLTLTEPAMTRFWISMDQAIDLVMLALKEGHGGEVFIPKIPACTVETLALAMAPEAEHKVIGIRPGEKMHESLITLDEAHNVLEYDRHYIILPNFPFWGGEPRTDGTRLPEGFHYTSAVADQLDVPQVRELLTALGFI